MYPDPKTEDNTWIPLAETVRKVAITKKERFLIWKRNKIQQKQGCRISPVFFCTYKKFCPKNSLFDHFSPYYI